MFSSRRQERVINSIKSPVGRFRIIGGRQKFTTSPRRFTTRRGKIYEALKYPGGSKSDDAPPKEGRRL